MAHLKLEDALRLAESPHVDDREMAARELQNHPFEAPVRSTLLDLMGDSDWRVRHAAIHALVHNRRTEIIPEILYSLYEETNAGKRNAALEALNQYGRDILPYLDAHLQSSNADVQMFLVNIIGDLRDTRHLPFLLECLQSAEENLVSAAILALGKIGDPSSVLPIVEKLHHKNVWFQFQAIEASGEMQDPVLLEHVLPLLHSPYCRRPVLSALGKFHHPLAYQALLGTLFHQEQPDPGSLRALREILETPQPERLRRQDREIIAKLCKEMLSEAQQEVFWKEMEDLYRADETSAAPYAGGTPAVPSPAVPSPVVPSPAVPSPAVPSLLQQLKSEEARAREHAARELASYSSPEVTEILLGSLTDEDVWVRVAIYKSLPVDDPIVVEVFKQHLPLENPIAQAAILRCFKKAKEPETSDLLLSYLNHPDDEIRASACEALASFDSDRVRQRLLHFLENDPSWNVRVSAIRALDQLKPEGYRKLLLERLEKDHDSSVRKQIVDSLQKFDSPEIPDLIFDFLRDQALADCACEFLLSRSSQKTQILQQATTSAPAIRRIVQRILE